MKKIYNLICFLYSNFCFLLEISFLKKKNYNKNSQVEINGFHKFQINYKNLFFESDFTIVDVNKYYKRHIISEEKIFKFIKNLFLDNDLANKISNDTGYNFSIDFITAYETFPINFEDQQEGWYANHPHIDKPFSKNTYKLIIPMEKISEQKGSMKILNKKDSLNYESKILDKFQNANLDINEVLIFNPNQCYHYAGIPKNGNSRKQIMIQLNPSKTWKVNKDIHKLQNKVEPKFPHFSYLFLNKTNLDSLNISL